MEVDKEMCSKFHEAFICKWVRSLFCFFLHLNHSFWTTYSTLYFWNLRRFFHEKYTVYSGADLQTEAGVNFRGLQTQNLFVQAGMNRQGF